MKKSPIHPKHETEFDPQLDFAQFLKEAKSHECDLKLDAETTLHSSEVAAKKHLDEGPPKNKNSWKKSLFSWLKGDKKSKPVPVPVPEEQQPSNKSHNFPKPRRSYLSGPMNGTGTCKSDNRPRRPSSGSLTGLFSNPTKKMEDKVPYVCLDKLNSPRVVQSYGPVYMVS